MINRSMREADSDLCSRHDALSGHLEPLTYNQALAKYRADDYSFRPPPVCTAQWGEADWILYIFGVRPPKGSQMDIAHQIANAYGNDGRNFGPEDVSTAISGMILDSEPTSIEELCSTLSARRYIEADLIRWEFLDASAIVEHSGSWDIGVTGESLDCVCWPEALEPGMKHSDDCPEFRPDPFPGPNCKPDSRPVDGWLRS